MPNPTATEILRAQLAQSLALTPEQLNEAAHLDGRYRPYPRKGMFVLVAYTKTDCGIEATTYGLDLPRGKFVVYYNAYEEAERKAQRLNARLG